MFSSFGLSKVLYKRFSLLFLICQTNTSLKKAPRKLHTTTFYKDTQKKTCVKPNENMWLKLLCVFLLVFSCVQIRKTSWNNFPRNFAIHTYTHAENIKKKNKIKTKVMMRQQQQQVRAVKRLKS